MDLVLVGAEAVVESGGIINLVCYKLQYLFSYYMEELQLRIIGVIGQIIIALTCMHDARY